MNHHLWEETSNYSAYRPRLDEKQRASFYFWDCVKAYILRYYNCIATTFIFDVVELFPCSDLTKINNLW